MRYGVAYVEGAFLLVLIAEYWASSIGDTVQGNLVFSARHPAPCWLESPDTTLRAADSRSVSETDCHIFRHLLETSAWCVCVRQLFQYANFSGSLYHSFSQNSSAFCLVWISGGTVWEAPGEKGVWASIVKILCSESLPGGCSIIPAARGATKIFKASCLT